MFSYAMISFLRLMLFTSVTAVPAPSLKSTVLKESNSPVKILAPSLPSAKVNQWQLNRSKTKYAIASWAMTAFFKTTKGNEFAERYKELLKKGLNQKNEQDILQLFKSLRDDGFLEQSQMGLSIFYESEHRNAIDKFVDEYNNALKTPLDPKSIEFISEKRRTALEQGLFVLESSIKQRYETARYNNYIQEKNLKDDLDDALNDPITYREWLDEFEQDAYSFDSSIGWEAEMNIKKAKYRLQASRDSLSAEQPPIVNYFLYWLKYNERDLFKSLKSPWDNESEEYMAIITKQLNKNGLKRTAGLINGDFQYARMVQIKSALNDPMNSYSQYIMEQFKNSAEMQRSPGYYQKVLEDYEKNLGIQALDLIDLNFNTL